MTKNLNQALCKAQGEFLVAGKSGNNPHFRSSFANFEDLVNASRPVMVKYGLAISQYQDLDEKTGYDILVTRLSHDSGEVLNSYARIYLKDPTDVQKNGAAIRYLKRYMYESILGLVTSDHDDDGNSLSLNDEEAEEIKPTSATISEKQLGFLKNLLKTQPEREAGLLARYGIVRLSELKWKYMQEVVDILSKTKD